MIYETISWDGLKLIYFYSLGNNQTSHIIHHGKNKLDTYNSWVYDDESLTTNMNLNVV